jgi:hypothetical protein
VGGFAGAAQIAAGPESLVLGSPTQRGLIQIGILRFVAPLMGILMGGC